MKEYVFISKNRKTPCCHRSDCRHFNSIKKENLIKIKGSKVSLKQGYKRCRHCFGIKADILRKKRELKEVCAKYQMKYTFSGSVVFVYSELSRWFFNFLDEYPVLFHQGFRSKNKVASEYHMQKNGKKYVNVTDVINYISKHDRKTQLTGYRNHKEERIQYLLDNIV